MKAKTKTASWFATLILVFAVGLVRGQGIRSQHLGATDPETEGFTFFGAGSVGPIVGDQGRDSWSVIGTGVPAQYFQSLTAQQQANIAGADWVLSATLRLIQTPNVSVSFYSDFKEFGLTFDRQPNGDPIVLTHSSLNPAFVLIGGGSGYHDYQLAYHAATGQAALWVDGTERVSDITGVPHFRDWDIFWGALAQGANSQANWNRVALEVVPEPSTLSLFCFGGVLVAGLVLRHSHERK